MTSEEVQAGREAVKRQVKLWKAKNPEWENASTLLYLKDKMTESTYKSYKSVLPMYLAFDDTTTDEMIKNRTAQLSNPDIKIKFHYEDRMNGFQKYLIDHHYKPKSIKTLLSRISGFFKNHRMPLQMGTTFWRSADKKASDAIKKTTTTKRFIVRDEVKAIIELSKNYEAVAYLLGFQCGLLPSDITNLTWDKIAIDFENKERDFVHVENTREKTGATHIFIITPDILHFLKNVWIEQGKPTEGYVFTGNTGKKMLKRNLPKLFRKRAIASLGETRGASLKFKDLRDAFNENLLDCNITAEVKDTLMGHLRESSKSSYSLAVASVVRIYRENVFQSIAVNGWTLKQQAQGYLELKLALKQLETENIAYKKRIDGLQEQIDRMEHNFNNIMVTIMNELELDSLMVPKLDSE